MNSTSINLYISNIEAENTRLKTLLQDKNYIIERLDAEISQLHKKLDIVNDEDCESEVGSCDEPIYEFDSDSDSDSESVSSLPIKVRRTLPPQYDTDTDSDSDDESTQPEMQSYNESLSTALREVAKNEENEFKREAFQNAANAIYKLPFEVTNGAEVSSGPKKVIGIGKGIAMVIDEFIATGNITRGESTNQKLAAAFDKLATLVSDCEYKANVYANAAEIVRNFKGPITSGKKLSEGPHKVKGIGKGVARMIDEFLSTGGISKIQELAK